MRGNAKRRSGGATRCNSEAVGRGAHLSSAVKGPRPCGPGGGLVLPAGAALRRDERSESEARAEESARVGTMTIVDKMAA